MPTPIAVYFVTSAAADTTNLVTPSFTPANSELITIGLTTWDTANPSGAVSGGAQTYTTKVTAAPGGFNGYARLDGCIISGSPGSMAVTSGGTGSNSRHSMCVIRWPVGTTFGAVNATLSGISAPSANVTTGAAASALFWMWSDVASLDPATLALRLSGTNAGVFDGHVGSNSVQYSAYAANVGVAGTYAVGATAPSPQTWAMVAVEILDAGGTAWTVNQTDGAGLTDTAALNVGKAATDSAGLTDTATLADSKAATDLAGLTDTAILDVAKPATDSTGLTDSLTLAHANAVTDSVGLTDGFGLSGSRTVTVTDSTGLTDSAAVVLPSAGSPEWTISLPYTAWHTAEPYTAWAAANADTWWQARNVRGRP